jgi:hypothetical protein
MNPFITQVMINNFTADYQIFLIGKKFKAMLMQTYLGNCIPCQLDFWKENGVWRTHHPLTQHVIYQFGTNIDNHLTALAVQKVKTSSVA